MKDTEITPADEGIAAARQDAQQEQQEPRKAYEVRVSWDTTDFWYAGDDFMDVLSRFAAVVEMAKGLGSIEMISTKDGKVAMTFPIGA